MKTTLSKYAAACMYLLLVAGCATTRTVEPEVVTIRPEIMAIQSYTEGVDSREAVTAVEDIVRDALQDADKRRRVAAELTKLLYVPGVTLDAKRAACRQLWLVAGRENVSSIAQLMGHAETADMARYAIERIPERVVDDQLLYYLDKGPDSAKPGIINSLAARRAEGAREAVEPLTSHRDAAIREAAAAALQKLPEEAEEAEE